MDFPDHLKTETPFGKLDLLDLSDTETQRRILSLDKHQILEGMVFEEYFEREICGTHVFRNFFTPIKAQTAIVKLANGRKGAFVLIDEKGPGLGQYLSRLSGAMPTWHVQYDGDIKDFVARRAVHMERPDKDGKQFYSGDPVPLNAVCKEFGFSNRSFSVADDVRDERRQNSAFWGGLYPSLTDERRSALVQARIFFNYCMTRHFWKVWNVDRVYVSHDAIWSFEIKHKSPMLSTVTDRCSFGLNEGEVENMRDFAAMGMRNMHVVIVKPLWKNDYSTQSMFVDNSHRKNTVIIGREIDHSAAVEALSQVSRHSGSHTTLTGKGKQGFKIFEAETFYQVGLKSDDGELLAAKIRAIAEGHPSTGCTTSELKKHRLS